MSERMSATSLPQDFGRKQSQILSDSASSPQSEFRATLSEVLKLSKAIPLTSNVPAFFQRVLAFFARSLTSK
jgi:hypothetical protein